MTLIEISLVTISILLVLIFLAIVASNTTRSINAEGIEARLKSIRKSNIDSKLSGVCAGLGKYTVVPAWIWRVIFLLLLFCGGVGLLAYVIFALCMPSAQDDVV